ncbi:hypothetical protein [Haloferula sp. A504]|uniref:hypothetical protein n=1 Tax=Haloferula sp. A504 TaxID=3373601 RepID=UPI0031CAE4BD|nr:hypothetical protein [Verrucomicrobiaceae bacterium E54]
MPDGVDDVLERARSRWPAPLPSGFADRVVTLAREEARRTPLILTGFGIGITAIASVASAAMIVVWSQNFQKPSATEPPAVFPAELPIVSR